MPLTLSGTSGVLDNSGALIRATAVATTSGTVADFTGIPSWVKQITVILSGVSTSGVSDLLIQIGSGSISNTGYASTGFFAASAGVSVVSSTAGFILNVDAATDLHSGMIQIANISSNSWVASGHLKANTNRTAFTAGDIALAGVLDRVRITTVNGTDTFDAGSVNILYE